MPDNNSLVLEYAVTNELSDDDFMDLCACICQAAYDHNREDAIIGWAENPDDAWKMLQTTSYVLACLLAQRKSTGVPTDSAFWALKMNEKRRFAERRSLVYDWFNDEG